MAEEAPQRAFVTARSYKRLRLSLFEQTLLAAMLLVLGAACVDAVDGQHVGKSDALAIAKLQGQQELMASTFKK